MTSSLITGASAGIGRAFAEVLATAGHDLVLVARDEARLTRLAEQLAAQHGVVVEVLAADLTTDRGCAAASGRLSDACQPIDVLVNCAGAGLTDQFVGASLAEEELRLDLLVRAVLRLTHAAAPGMVARGHGRIINVSSAAGWAPVGTYGAAKAWVTTFTEGLAIELTGTGVSATAVCPGFTRTEFHARAGMDVTGIPDWAWLDAPRVAEEAWADAQKGRVISVASKRYAVLALVLRHLPRSVLRHALTVAPRPRPGAAVAGAAVAGAPMSAQALRVNVYE